MEKTKKFLLKRKKIRRYNKMSKQGRISLTREECQRKNKKDKSNIEKMRTRLAQVERERS